MTVILNLEVMSLSVFLSFSCIFELSNITGNNSNLFLVSIDFILNCWMYDLRLILNLFPNYLLSCICIVEFRIREHINIKEKPQQSNVFVSNASCDNYIILFRYFLIILFIGLNALVYNNQRVKCGTSMLQIKEKYSMKIVRTYSDGNINVSNRE